MSDVLLHINTYSSKSSMIVKNLLLYASLALAVTGCSKTTIKINPTPPKPVPAVYRITEDFENATKGSYAAADISTPTGNWNFDNALVGNLAADLKNGSKSIRMKTGKVTMNFDVDGLSMLYISHGKYGTDPSSTWKLLYSTDGGLTYTQLGQDIIETNTTLVTDSFVVTPSAHLRFQIQNVGSTASARINLDDITFKGTGNPGLQVGVPDSAPTDTVKTGTASGTRGVDAGPDAEPAIGDNSNLLFGNPSGATSIDSNNFFIDQKYYAESYSSSRSIPNWVSWHLDSSNITNATGRLDNFAGFNGLPQSYYVVQSNSYSGSGFDRGHNCPSADRTSSSAANSATFLMTNMIPQAPRNNQQTWAGFENYLRTQVVAGNEVYIIMGSYGSGGVGSNGVATTINGGKVTVPANVWKVALIIPEGNGDINRVTSAARIIAINTANINTIDADWTKYIVTIRDIEKVTGYDLLSALPKSLQDQLEVKRDLGN
jgi:endonuclease G